MSKLQPARPSSEVRAFIPYEIPLRPDVQARLVLPVDLTPDEAERLCGVIRTLAFEDEAPADISR